MCEDPPAVDNSELREVNSVMLLSGDKITSEYEYVCNNNYHIDDESKMMISCQSGSASWDYTSLPVCLRGLFNINHAKYEFFKYYFYSLRIITNC